MAVTEANTELIDRVWEEAVENGEMDVVEEALASDYVLHTLAAPEPIHGREGFVEYKHTLHEAFPDLSVTVENRVVGEDAVVDRYRMTGTHEGEFNGVAPTGTEVEFTGLIVHHLEDGKVVEDVVEFDLFGLMRQLGVVEPPGE